MFPMFTGLNKFSEEIYPNHRAAFEGLANGQSPHTMLITCSDSRIDPNLFTQTKPGEIFVLRNAGNIVPPYGSSHGGEESAIEFGIRGLGVQNIVICGHSKCGAMAALTSDGDMSALPSTAAWLKHARATKDVAKAHKHTDLNECIEDNVLVQIQNLKTHPAVAAALAAKKINLYGWVYQFENGTIKVYHNEHKKFIPSTELKNSANHNEECFKL